MSDYIPVFTPADAVPATTSATVTGGQLLAVSGNGTVAPAAAGSAAYIGVASFDAANGARVTYTPRGVIHESIADGGITAMDQVQAGATGKVKSLAAAAGNAAADITAARAVIGTALTTATDGNKVRWMAW
ncbi:capsid cement protein [Streptosporangium sp. V21-05]|uniref:capsid cement protein n=1 Tax=Streptosporangium sp. V21-05 TaxID=3446115 RepID=UPI003F533BC6